MAEVVGRDEALAAVVGGADASDLRSYLVQEEDGVSRFTLEEGGGSILLAESAGQSGRVVGVDAPTAVVEDQ